MNSVPEFNLGMFFVLHLSLFLDGSQCQHVFHVVVHVCVEFVVTLSVLSVMQLELHRNQRHVVDNWSTQLQLRREVTVV